MDQSAISEIANMAVAGAQALTPAHLRERVIAMPSDFTLQSTERFHDNPLRFRGHFETPSIADFIDYANKNSNGSSQVFTERGNQAGAAKKMTAKAVFDFGSVAIPEFGEHNATLEIPPTPDFERFVLAPNKEYDQRTLIHLIEDLGPSASFTHEDDDGDHVSINYAEGVAAIREVKITKISDHEHTQGDMKQSRSALDSVEATSKRGMPSGILFEGIAYEGLPVVTLWARLALHPGGDKPTFTLRIPRLEAMMLKAESDLRDVLRTKLLTPVLVGTFTKK